MNSIKKTPLVIKRKDISQIKRNCISNDNVALLRCMTITRPVFVKEDIIYKSQAGDFMKGEYPDLTILNRLDVLANSSRTIAKYTGDIQGSIERTSDNVKKVIGQKNYDTVFSALCSVISQELRIKGILALLTVKSGTNDVSCQTDINFDKKITHTDITSILDSSKSNFSDVSSQTDETCSDLLHRFTNTKRKIRKPQQAPYVLKDSNNTKSIKKIVIKPQHFSLACQTTSPINSVDIKRTYRNKKKFANEDADTATISSLHKETRQINDHLSNNTYLDNNVIKCDNITSLPDLRLIVDEDSNISDISSGNISLKSYGIPNLLDNPSIILNNIDKHTQEPIVDEETILKMLDGREVKLQSKPKDDFHIATPEILRPLNSEHRTNVMLYQAYIDWKSCLTRDEDDNLPIHVAVLNDDVDFLRRQCIVLKNRGESVDVLAQGNLTPLQISLWLDTAQCTELLLQHGANPLVPDEEQRTALHLAAEVPSEHLKVIIAHCKKNARNILEDNNLWITELDSKSDETITKYLFEEVCKMCDVEGYTPLMLASKLGNYANVKILLDANPTTVNMPMPNSGNTALYIAVVDACNDAEKRGNKSKIGDNYLMTIETLIKYGACPSIENNSGSSVNILCNDFNNSQLSCLIANTLISVKFNNSPTDTKMDFRDYMLVKDDSGTISFQEIKAEPTKVKEIEIFPIDKECTETMSAKATTSSDIRKDDLVTKTEPTQTITFPEPEQEEAAFRKLNLTDIKKRQKVKLIVPVSRGSGLMKRMSIDKGSNNTIQLNTVTAIPPSIPKIITVNELLSKLDKNNVTKVSTSVIMNSSDGQNTANKKSLHKDITLEVPIKKRKME